MAPETAARIASGAVSKGDVLAVARVAGIQAAKQTPHLKYIEDYDMVLGADGKVRPELFVEDKLHFNAEGYKLLVERVRPYLPK